MDAETKKSTALSIGSTLISIGATGMTLQFFTGLKEPMLFTSACVITMIGWLLYYYRGYEKRKWHSEQTCNTKESNKGDISDIVDNKGSDTHECLEALENEEETTNETDFILIKDNTEPEDDIDNVNETVDGDNAYVSMEMDKVVENNKNDG